MKSGLERRSQARFAVHCHVRFFQNSSSEVTDCVTQNISSVGFYCLSRTAFSVGDSLTCLLKMPWQDSLEKPFTLRCAVSVVRVEDAGEGSFGVACKIDDYQVCSITPRTTKRKAKSDPPILREVPIRLHLREFKRWAVIVCAQSTTKSGG